MKFWTVMFSSDLSMSKCWSSLLILQKVWSIYANSVSFYSHSLTAVSIAVIYSENSLSLQAFWVIYFILWSLLNATLSASQNCFFRVLIHLSRSLVLYIILTLITWVSWLIHQSYTSSLRQLSRFCQIVRIFCDSITILILTMKEWTLQ